jgi:hypothetical protein
LGFETFYISKAVNENYLVRGTRLLNKVGRILLNKELIYIPRLCMNIYKHYELKRDKLLDDITLHLCQSKCAEEHLKAKGISNLTYLSEYINNDFLESRFDVNRKQDIVTYNSKRGYMFTKKIIKNAKNIKFIPIINMKRNEVIELLKNSKVYIDFGSFSGKDRLPREAAILGCCVITGKKGSAKYFEDVPILEEYKFEDKEENIYLILNKIKDCLKNYNIRYKDFENYRNIIKKEPENFINNLKKIFNKKTRI